MERNESAHGLQLIKIASIKLRGRFSSLFMGALAMVTPLLLLALIPTTLAFVFDVRWLMAIGVCLFAILLGPLQVGYIKYYNAIMVGKQPPMSYVYSELKFSARTLRIIYISSILLAMYILGGILWILPAGFAISFYSMSLFFYEHGKSERMTVAMKECSRKMIGNRVLMFSYKLIFYFVYALLLIVGLLSILLVCSLASENLIVGWIVGVCIAIVFIFSYAFITVYYHSCNEVFFEDICIMHKKKIREKEIKEKEKAEKKVELETNEVEKRPSAKTSTKKKEATKKATPKKTNAKKTTTKNK